MKALLVAAAVCLPVQSDSSGQDFWNGGPGVPGPVSYWGNTFSSCEEMDYSFAHSIQLLIEYTFHWIHSTGPGGEEMEIVDTDGDGDLDVVSSQAAWDRISHWENLDGSGLNWSRTIIADSLNAPFSLDAVDMDQDGDVDFAVATGEGPYWIENTGGTWIKHQIGDVDCWWIAAGDLDGDGDDDVFCGDYMSDDLRWWENLDGVGGAWAGHFIANSYTQPRRVRIADVDGDSDLDLLMCKQGPPNIVWFENTDGSGDSWTPHVVCQYVASQYLWIMGLEAVDLDLDGDMDIVAAGSDPMPEGAVVWVENLDGLGTSWLKHPIDSDLSGATSVSSGDLDGDGDLDVMAGSGGDFGERLAAWYENVDGQATAWSRHVLDETTWYATDIASADMDADGDPDVVFCDGIAGVRWYEFSRATLGWLESSILDPPGGSQLQWTDLSWDATVPAGTNLTLQVRASNDPSDMGDWSPEISTPGSISAYLPDPCWYFQYRVNMATSTPPTTPTLDELLVQYNPVGIEGQPEADEPTLTVLSGNPSPGSVVLDVYLPEAGEVNLGIYDIAGRLVEMPLSGQAESGHHQLTVTDLPSGCYRAVMETENSKIGSRLVVLR